MRGGGTGPVHVRREILLLHLINNPVEVIHALADPVGGSAQHLNDGKVELGEVEVAAIHKDFAAERWREDSG